MIALPADNFNEKSVNKQKFALNCRRRENEKFPQFEAELRGTDAIH